VSGLLIGLALLVMLPSAMEQAADSSISARRVLFIFCAAPPTMFLVHHVLLDHTHVAEGGNSEECPCGPSCDPQAHVKNLMMPGSHMKFCSPVKTPQTPARASPSPSILPITTTTANTPCSRTVEAMSVLLRALPYTIHASIDGLVLGTATSTMRLLQVSLPVALCAVQDVGAIIVNMRACGTSLRGTLLAVACFALGFPLGTSVAAVLISAPGDTAALAPLQAMAAGIFVYMAAFELAPPHAHGRSIALRYVSAFAAGLVLVCLSEAAEEVLVQAISATEGGDGGAAFGDGGTAFTNGTANVSAHEFHLVQPASRASAGGLLLPSDDE